MIIIKNNRIYFSRIYIWMTFYHVCYLASRTCWFFSLFSLVFSKHAFIQDMRSPGHGHGSIRIWMQVRSPQCRTWQVRNQSLPSSPLEPQPRDESTWSVRQQRPCGPIFDPQASHCPGQSSQLTQQSGVVRRHRFFYLVVLPSSNFPLV